MNIEPKADQLDPWPGLASYDEESQDLFNGRDAECSELLRLVQRDAVTVLYGKSGLGKTSLLKAGLFPLLRANNLLPIYVRLDHSPTAPLLDEQLFAALFASRDATPSPRIDNESLWAYLHREDAVIWSRKNYPLTPVFVLDQFEELFTALITTTYRDDVLRSLGALIDNRPPDDMHIPTDGAADYNFERQGLQLVLSMRQDFLHELDRLRPFSRSSLQNRLRLWPMDGEQAYAAVFRTGGSLVDESVASAIVEFLGRPTNDSREGSDLRGLEVEPALLSVFCRELNERRKTRGLAKLDIKLLTDGQSDILPAFYDRSVADLDPRVRVFLQEELITETGRRQSAALDALDRMPGVTRADIETLVTRRLVRVEDRFGVEYVELTHDVLAPIVKDRRERDRVIAAQALRMRKMRANLARLAAAAIVIAIAGTAWGFSSRKLYTKLKESTDETERARATAEAHEREALLEADAADQFMRLSAKLSKSQSTFKDSILKFVVTPRLQSAQFAGDSAAKLRELEGIVCVLLKPRSAADSAWMQQKMSGIQIDVCGSN